MQIWLVGAIEAAAETAYLSADSRFCASGHTPCYLRKRTFDYFRQCRRRGNDALDQIEMVEGFFCFG